MSDFVLVHGSGQNAGSWARVAALLAADGHAVSAPELPKQAPGWRLEDYAACIARHVPGPDTIVVAHSLSGAFLPLIPEMRACAMLVYLAAVIPEPGQSLRDQFTADATMFSPGWIAAGAGMLTAEAARTVAREFLFHDCDAATVAWALDTVELMQTGQLVIQPCPVSAWPTVPGYAIAATEDRTLTPDWCRRAARRRLQTEPIEIGAGHCPHVSRPAEVAAILERLAASSSP